MEIPHFDTNLAAFYEWPIRGNTLNPIADGRMHPDDMDKVTEKNFTYEDFVEISYFIFKEFFDFIAKGWKLTGYVKPEAWEQYLKAGAATWLEEFTEFPVQGGMEKKTWSVKLENLYSDLIEQIKEIVKDDDPETFRLIYIVHI